MDYNPFTLLHKNPFGIRNSSNPLVEQHSNHASLQKVPTLTVLFCGTEFMLGATMSE